MRRKLWGVLPCLTFVSIACAIPLGVFSANAPENVLLTTMQRELKRATTSLAKADPAPYYLSYAVTDLNGSVIWATNGSLLVSTTVRRRQADVMMRVGSAALDNTHGNRNRGSGITSGILPLNSDTDATA